MKMNTLAAALCATASLPVVAAMPAVPRADTFDDIQYWVGNGAIMSETVIAYMLAWCRGCPAVAKGTSGDFYANDPQCWASVENGLIEG